MDSKETKLREEYEDLQKRLEDPAIFSSKEYPRLAKRQSELQKTIYLFEQRRTLQKQLAEAKELAGGNDELAQLAQTEMPKTQSALDDIEQQLTDILTPQ